MNPVHIGKKSKGIKIFFDVHEFFEADTEINFSNIRDETTTNQKQTHIRNGFFK